MTRQETADPGSKGSPRIAHPTDTGMDGHSADSEPTGEPGAQPEKQQINESLVTGPSDEVVGSSDKGKTAAEALVALGRAARCFLIYSPDNEAISIFLDNLKKKMDSYLERFGDMPLDIRPWEMVLDDEVIYLNRDRERSLSFRLFRDGVRKVVLRRGVDWSELTRFLGIISIRFTGIRQQEDDIVTLLWKAGFKNIEVEAVEGFVPEDEETEMEAAAVAHTGAKNAMQAMIIGEPYTFDVPWPEFKKRARIRYQEVEPDLLRALAKEEDSRALAGQCVRLVWEILEISSNPVEPMRLQEALPIIREIRDFLLAEGLLSSVLELVRKIDETSFREQDKDQKDDLLRAFADAKALGRIIHTIPSDQQEVPRELVEMVDLIPGDKFSVLLDILEKERGTAARRITRQLIVREAVGRVDYLVTVLKRAEPAVAVDLMRALAQIDMARASEVAVELSDHDDVELQLAALNVLENAEYDQQLGLGIGKMLQADTEEVRLRALKILVKHKERWAFNGIVRRLETGSLRGIQPREAVALGEALASIWDRRALHQFRKWLKPRGIVTRMISGQQMLRWAAVSGLALIEGEEPEKLIRWVARSAGAELHEHCMQSLVRHRHKVTGNGAKR